jgi:hypothetical protein
MLAERLRAGGELLKQIRQLSVAVLLHELRNAVDPVPAAGLADDRQGWPTDVGQGQRAITRLGAPSSPPDPKRLRAFRTPGSLIAATISDDVGYSLDEIAIELFLSGGL